MGNERIARITSGSSTESTLKPTGSTEDARSERPEDAWPAALPMIPATRTRELRHCVFYIAISNFRCNGVCQIESGVRSVV